MKNLSFNTLDEIIEKALTSVRSHPRHDLELGYRQAIWAALESSPGNGDVGRKRRLLLAILSAKHVLPLWEKLRPDDNLPHRCLAKAEQSLFDRIEALEDDYMAAIQIIDDLEYEPVIAAGHCAVETLSTTLWDERFDPTNIDYSLTNEDLDPDYDDPALIASYAYANGSIWEESSNDHKRLEFWEWWLTEAVLKAWQAFPVD